jgi:two-component system, NarL family, response regulator NreC
VTSRDQAAGAGAAEPRRIRIVLADDHRVVRRGLELVLNAEPEFEVVAEVGDVDAVRRALREHQPDVLVLDLNMPGEPSLPAIPALRAAAPDTQIVVLTMEYQPAYVREARRAGALGYVLKEAADSELAEAVRRAAAGAGYLNRRLAERLVADTTIERDWG